MKRELIIDEAFIMFSENGYYGTSLAKLANKVGIKKPSLYNYFTNKDELYEICIKRCMDRGINNLEKINITSSSTKEDIYELSKNYIFDDIKYISFYFQLQSSPKIHEDTVIHLNNIKQEIIEEKLKSYFSEDKYKTEKIIHLRTFYNGWLARRYFSRNIETLKISLKEFKIDFNYLYDKILFESE
ncbi:TetR/AcrR family transcriptional regulator [Mammaliicoccus sciuri]|uniref:TetR/AcrR family transcriptional regulator n=1 Tax=Mammaliicoccus sciuri TaxID=1296 RepID=UPI002DB952D6|nr:TetR/AcrR family transcriptional regulator [Mammaliicoccus sciuri]MEB7784253.1 TetR/AcrR family transcriptional regulator [Mammaliicoccus sciuri]